MVDLDFRGQINFFQICIIFKVNHHSYIICFRFAEILDLDYVKINTKIKSVACIQPEIMKVIYPIYNQTGRSSYNSQLDLDFEGQLSRSCD